MTEELSLRDRLYDFLEATIKGAEIYFTDPTPIVAGSSKAIWSFDVEWQDEYEQQRTAELILRQDKEAGVVSSELQREHDLLRALEGWLLRVPTIFAADLTGQYFGQPTLLIEREPGRTHRAVLRDKDPLDLGHEGRLSLARDMVDLLARLHHLVDEEVAAALPDPGNDPARHELTRWEGELDAEELDPADRLRPAREWLHANLPEPPARLSLVHGDFRPANVLVEDGEISALLDWELAHMGDAADDLGWYTCSIYRVEHFPEGWSVEDFLTRYVEEGGREPEPERLRFWQVFSVFRLTVIALRAARNIESGKEAGMPPPIDRLIDQLAADIA